MKLLSCAEFPVEVSISKLLQAHDRMEFLERRVKELEQELERVVSAVEPHRAAIIILTGSPLICEMALWREVLGEELA